MAINSIINKNSIFFSITLFFIVLIITTHAIIYIGYTITKKEQNSLLVNRYMETLYKIRIKYSEENGISSSIKAKRKPFYINLDKDMLRKLLKEYNLIVPIQSYEILQKHGNFLDTNGHWELYELNGYTYFYIDDKLDSVLIKDIIKINDKTLYFISLTLLLNITFLLFYLFLLKKLSPLNELKSSILKFSKGDLNINTSSSGKDEISEVSNEFNNAIIQIKELTESRNLFLRNIMHELKTPITKGKLIIRLTKDEKHKDLLNKIFERLEYLLQEFAKIEQLTSKNIDLEIEKYRFVDLLDQSLDMLMISKEDILIDIKSTLFINADFYLFSIVLKNLVDNGLKYGTKKVKIEVNENSVAIISEGKMLEKGLEEYLQPFNRKYETTSQSLGLGLYIVGKILKLHHLKLQYKYENNQNIFFINFI